MLRYLLTPVLTHLFEEEDVVQNGDTKMRNDIGLVAKVHIATPGVNV